MVGAGEGVSDDIVVASCAQQDPDGGGVTLRNAEVAVDPADVEAELADVLGRKLADLELDSDEARLVPVEEEQVDVIPTSG